MLQDHARWTGAYGETISSDLHGDGIPQMNVVTPARGREMSETYSRKKEERFTRDTLADLDSGGSFSSIMTLSLGGS
jgi:hypothetical protein